MKLVIIMLLFIPLLNSIASEVVLTEKLIELEAAKNPPSIDKLEATFLQSQAELMGARDRFSYTIDANGSLFKSDERLLGNFDGGVTQRAAQYKVGINKPTQYGVNLNLSAFAQKASNAFINDAATQGLSFQVSIDLYKNFLGKLSRSDLEQKQKQLKRAQLEKELGQKIFHSTLKKLYWSMVANEEERNLLSSLVKLSKKQFDQALKRQKAGIADSGEVARYRSQWTTQKASFLSTQYSRSEILKVLKQYLPSLQGKKIKVGPYNIEKSIQEVLSCSKKMKSYKSSPLEFTPYDEITQFLEQELKLKDKALSTYDSADIKIVGEYASVGRGFGFDAANEDFSDDSQARKSIGLNISIPFGGSKKNTREVNQKVLQKKYKSQIDDTMAKIQAYHTETSETIGVLREVVRNQKETNFYLEQSLKSSKRKFKQARISLQEFIAERDILIRSKVSEIQTNLTIAHTLLDYFSIYPNFPCAFNRI